MTDLSSFYETAATLSPVLLLTAVLGLRQTALLITRPWRVVVVLLTVAPAIVIEAFALGGLAGNGQHIWPVLIPLWIQLGTAMATFAGALLDPETNQVS